MSQPEELSPQDSVSSLPPPHTLQCRLSGGHSVWALNAMTGDPVFKLMKEGLPASPAPPSPLHVPNRCSNGIPLQNACTAPPQPPLATMP